MTVLSLVTKQIDMSSFFHPMHVCDDTTIYLKSKYKSYLQYLYLELDI